MKQIYTGIGISSTVAMIANTIEAAPLLPKIVVYSRVHIYRIKQVNIADCTDPFERRIT